MKYFLCDSEKFFQRKINCKIYMNDVNYTFHYFCKVERTIIE